MAEDHIRYDILMRDALTGVVRKVLAEVAKTGLPGDHYFYISFATRSRGVRIAKRLLERYPEEMTIVLQNQFWDLAVGDNGFEVGLSFDDQPEILIIPFSSILGFYDPSVEFGLKFEVEDHAGPAAESHLAVPEPAEGEAPAELAALAQEDGPPDADKVVSLDQFRKKT